MKRLRGASIIFFCLAGCGGAAPPPPAPSAPGPAPSLDVSATPREAGPAPETSATPSAGNSSPAIKSLPQSSIHFAGGDGASKEHAIKIIGASSENEGVDAEYSYLNALYGAGKWQPGSQALISVAGKNVDQLEITNPAGKTEKFFFDISDFFGKF